MAATIWQALIKKRPRNETVALQEFFTIPLLVEITVLTGDIA